MVNPHLLDDYRKRSGRYNGKTELYDDRELRAIICQLEVLIASVESGSPAPSGIDVLGGTLQVMGVDIRALLSFCRDRLLMPQIHDSMEVRCCCNPDKLYGWLPISNKSFNRKTPIRFTLRGSLLNYDFKRTETAFEYMTLTVDTIHTQDGCEYHALKSNDAPIEKLRRIAGFIERTWV